MFDLKIKNPFGQRLLTKAITDKVPALYEQDGKGDEAIVYVKYFLGSFTWYVTELDQETGIAFGKVFSHIVPEGELGYIDLNELAETKVRGFAVVERDQYFDPQPLKDCN